jgi:threonine/homoserine/homoserine lactone efflux protein
MSLLLEGMAVGFSIAAPVGAIGFLCIQQTLHGGIWMGIASGLGAATADTVYGIIVALGMTFTQTFLLQYKLPLTIIGGLFLCYLGIKKFFSAPPSAINGAVNASLLSAYIVTFFLTFTNPATILDFAALFTGLSIDTSGYVNGLTFIAGVFIGSALWWFILCFSVGLLRHKISGQVLRYINYAAGIVIFGFGLYCLTKVWLK